MYSSSSVRQEDVFGSPRSNALSSSLVVVGELVDVFDDEDSRWPRRV